MGNFAADSSGKVWPDALFGSQYFAQHPPSADYQPLFGVLFDMIGDATCICGKSRIRCSVHRRSFAECGTRQESSATVGTFMMSRVRVSTDDQVPLLNRGWHVIDLVDSPYGVVSRNAGPDERPNPNYHHTTLDTVDKISARSLQIVGDVAVALVK